MSAPQAASAPAPAAPTPPERPLAGGWLRVGPARASTHQRIELAFFALVLLVAFVTSPQDPAGAPNAPLMGWLEENTGGGLCLFRRATGIECGGCGLTRAFVQLAHGEVLAAVRLNPLAPFVFTWIAWRVVELLALVGAGRRLRHGVSMRWVWRIYGAAGAGFLILATVRLLHGLGAL